MPRRTISEELEQLVEKHKGLMQFKKGRPVSFDEALADLLNGKKDKENELFRI